MINRHPCAVHSVVTVALLLAAAAAPSMATCGSASCFLMTGTREGVSTAGSLRFDLSYRYVDQSRRLSGDHSIGEVLTPKIDFEEGEILPDHHREVRTQNTLMELDLDYGITDRFTLSGALPFYNERDHEHFDDAGTPAETFTRQDGTSGFGDVRVGGRYAFFLRPKDMIVAGADLKLPTGTYRLRDSEGEINEPTIQPGTGSADLIGSLHWEHQVPSMSGEWVVFGSYRANTSNDLHYRMGNEAMVHAGFNRRSGRRAIWSLQVNGRQTRRDRFLGRRVPSTGALSVSLTPGLSLLSTTGTRFYLFLQEPIHQDVNEEQIAARRGIVLGISRSFD